MPSRYWWKEYIQFNFVLLLLNNAVSSLLREPLMKNQLWVVKLPVLWRWWGSDMVGSNARASLVSPICIFTFTSQVGCSLENEYPSTLPDKLHITPNSLGKMELRSLRIRNAYIRLKAYIARAPSRILCRVLSHYWA